MSWVQHLLIGSAATMIGIIAVAALGAAALTGRIPMRRGVNVIFGLFIVFSASTIASGIAGTPAAVQAPPLAVADPSYIPATPAPLPYDPYAGASVPQRGTETLPAIR